MKLQGKGFEYLVVSATIIVVVLIVFFISKAIARKRQQQADGVVDKAKSQLNSKNVTLSAVQVSSIADKLFQSMNGPGGDPWSIIAAFNEVKNIDDLLAVIVAFGKRKSTSWFISFDENLPSWINSELNAYWLKKLNDSLTDKNINYKF